MTKGNFICVSRKTTLAVGASADMLKLRSGETVQGVFLGADSSQLTFQDPNEQPVTYPLGRCLRRDVCGSGSGGTTATTAAINSEPTKAEERNAGPRGRYVHGYSRFESYGGRCGRGA
jgi:hypothetical protein